MTTPEDVLIAGERHLIIHGQFGNLDAGVARLHNLLADGGDTTYSPYLSDIREELDYLVKIYPAVDGGLNPVDAQRPIPCPAPTPSKDSLDIKVGIVRARLMDMRAIVDAAYMSHTHEGAIDCHLKRMFDVAWETAADEVGIERIDDIPF